MQAAELVLSVLGSSARPIDGRTAIQKIAYFASIKAGIDVGYRPHFYGPYSADVAQNLQNLESTGYMTETTRLTTHDRIMYSYCLNDDGQKMVREIQKREQSKYNKIKKVSEICEKVAKNNINVLSWAAKVYFLLSKKGSETSYNEVIQLGSQLGWKLSDREIDSGAKLLTRLGLVKKS